MAMAMRLQCMSCFESIGAGPPKQATLTFFEALIADHVCPGDKLAPPANGGSAMSREEIQRLIDEGEKT